jgi:hypothetical protein
MSVVSFNPSAGPQHGLGADAGASDAPRKIDLGKVGA